MKKVSKAVVFLLASVLMGCWMFFGASAAAQDTIYNGVYIESINVSGMTQEEATAAVQQYLDEMAATTVSFTAAQGQTVVTTYGDLGIEWVNPGVVEEALNLASGGNVIARYRTMKDVEYNGVNYELQISFNTAAVETFLTENCSIYDLEVKNATLSRENGEFVIQEGSVGEAVNVSASLAEIQENLFIYYKQGMTTIPLVVEVVEPEGTAEDLALVTDVLGTYTTSYTSSGANRSANVANGCSLINGITLYPGEEFSTYDTVKPFTTDNGYYMAGSYLNGQVVDSLGGGICQVSSTLYNAVLLAELEVTERHPHSMIVTYVPKSSDAAIAESSGKDFCFVNNTDYPIYIEGYTENKHVTFNIYGVETRPENRTIEYVSEVISQTVPDYENIIADSGAVIGAFSIQSAHVGYRARLWKVVYEDGVEVSREEVNTSTYSSSPRTARVGVLTSNPDHYNRMMAAIATGSIDYCQAVAAQIVAESSAAPQ